MPLAVTPYRPGEAERMKRALTSHTAIPKTEAQLAAEAKRARKQEKRK